MNQQAVCSCLPQYVGSPPNCRPECTISSECSPDKSCVNQKCVDPCPGTCGLNAQCLVINHSPICSCKVTFTGDPFSRCYPIPPPIASFELIPINPCLPSPCGPNSECREISGTPSCSCQVGYIGSPPNCRPECLISADCQSSLACIHEKCRNPCEGACGIEVVCKVVNHVPVCTCPEGYTGDPFSRCYPKPPRVEVVERNPCDLCGTNTLCENEICRCLPEYQGDPYVGCRPECTSNNDCAKNKACLRNKCVDPCPGICGTNAECSVINHIPVCVCLTGYSGNAFISCSKIAPPVLVNPCVPSPCGSNSRCKEINGQAVCSCVEGFIGSPPSCRPECVMSSDCLLNQACVNQKCIDPCPGSCGVNTKCQVVNHNPICSCLPDYTGDPFTRCLFKGNSLPKKVVEAK